MKMLARSKLSKRMLVLRLKWVDLEREQRKELKMLKVMVRRKVSMIKLLNRKVQKFLRKIKMTKAN